jgi:hypothetical protein
VATLLFSFAKQTSQGSERRPGFSVFEPPEQISKAFHHRYAWFEDHLSHRFLNENISPLLQERLKEIMDIPRRFENLGEVFFQSADAYVEERRRSPLWGFRFFQWVVYGLIFAAFLLSTGGEDAWRHLFQAPSGRAFTDLLLSIIGTLFSTTGLAALGSFLIINLGTGFIFYRRYRNILLRKTQKNIGRLKEILTRVWMNSVEAILRDLALFEKQLLSQKAALSRLQKGKGIGGKQ